MWLFAIKSLKVQALGLPSCAELDKHIGRHTFQDFPTHISTIFLVMCPNTIKSILINKTHYKFVPSSEVFDIIPNSKTYYRKSPLQLRLSMIQAYS